MKNLLRNFIVLIFITSLSFSVEAQFIKKIQKAANKGVERAIQDKVEKEAAKMTEKQLEKVFSDMYGDNADGSSMGGLDMNKVLAGIGEPVDTQDEYAFFGHVILEMISTDEKGKTADPVFLKSFLAKTDDYTGMELVDPKNPKSMTAMVFDVKNQASVVFLDNKGDKSSFAYKMDFDDVNEMAEEKIDESIEETTIEKTGKTKEILGYDCEEYYVKNADGEGYYWVTEEPIGGYSSFWSSNSPLTSSKNQEKYVKHFGNLPKGNFMELNYTSEETGTVEMKVKEINESAPLSFTMAEYPNIMNSAGQN